MEAAPDRYSLETAPHRYNMGPLSFPTVQWATGILKSSNWDVLLDLPTPSLQFALPPDCFDSILPRPSAATTRDWLG